MYLLFFFFIIPFFFACSQNFISETLLKLNDSPLMWQSYLLDFLMLFYPNVTVKSELFTHFEKEAKIHCSSDTFGKKLFWLHLSFAMTPRNVLNILKLGSELSVVSVANFSGQELIEILKDREATAEKLLDVFFNLVKNYKTLFKCPEDEAKHKLTNCLETVSFIACIFSLYLSISIV